MFRAVCLSLQLLLSVSHGFVEFPSSCVGEADGYKWVKPLEGDLYPPINQLCDNEYMVIDLNRDANVAQYLSSHDSWHYALSGPSQMDSANWENWFLPNAKFLHPEEPQIDSEDTQSQSEPAPEPADDDLLASVAATLAAKGISTAEIELIVAGIAEKLASRTPSQPMREVLSQHITSLSLSPALADLDIDDLLSRASEEYFRYVLSPDCSSCRSTVFDMVSNRNSASNDDLYGDRTAYYMTGSLFGCADPSALQTDCAWDYDSYECSYCTNQESDGDLGYHATVFPEAYDADSTTLGVCGVYPQSTASSQVPEDQSQCASMDRPIKPSLGDDGRFCVCYKPQKSYDISTKWRSSPKAFDVVQEEWEQRQLDQITDLNQGVIGDIVELYQEDFTDGTLRIEQSGTYKIMEDIIFDFNAGDLEGPNEGDKQWWPMVEQSEDYPGAESWRDEYFMGFFAGITVEVDDVVIDLNGFEIAMSPVFYYQQRFFSCIALKSVVYALNEGPGMFGAHPHYASNVVIKDGSIGLSSHHGIHGQKNDDVRIENVHVHSFETHGIEMSEFSNLKLKNVEIGPSSNRAFLKAEYGYARFTLQKLERLRDSVDTDLIADIFPVAFDQRSDELSLDEIIESLRSSMDIALRAVLGEEQYSDTDPAYQTAKSLFINEDGVPYGGVMYGLFLNLDVAAIHGMHPSLRHSQTALIENLEVHDLNHKTVEYVRLDQFGSAPYTNPYSAAVDASALLGKHIIAGQNIKWNTVRYVGNALTDAHVVLDMLTQDAWGEKGAMRLGDEFSGWALGEMAWDDADEYGHPYLGCNNDAMTMVPKGVIGVRLDGVDNAALVGLDVYNLYENADVGSVKCGEYWDEDFSDFKGMGHFHQSAPYLFGYTGNMAHGVMADWSSFAFEGEVNIHHIYSQTGLVRGVGLYTESHITFYGEDGEVNVYDVDEDEELDEEESAFQKNPYKSVAEADAEEEVDEDGRGSRTIGGSAEEEEELDEEEEEESAFQRNPYKSVAEADAEEELDEDDSEAEESTFTHKTKQYGAEEEADEEEEELDEEESAFQKNPYKSVADDDEETDETEATFSHKAKQFGTDDEAQDLPPVNPFKMASKAQQEDVVVSGESGKLDTRTAEEQNDAGQGDRQNAEAADELPATNPYKTYQGDAAEESEKEQPATNPYKTKQVDEDENDAQPPVNPYKMADKQEDADADYSKQFGWDGEDKKNVYGKAAPANAIDEEDKLSQKTGDSKPVGGKGGMPGGKGQKGAAGDSKMPVLPRQLRRQVHRMKEAKKHSQSDAKRRLQEKPQGKAPKPKSKSAMPPVDADTKFMQPSIPKDKTGAIASLPDISTKTDPKEGVPDYEGQGYEGHDVGAAQENDAEQEELDEDGRGSRSIGGEDEEEELAEDDSVDEPTPLPTFGGEDEEEFDDEEIDEEEEHVRGQDLDGDGISNKLDIPEGKPATNPYKNKDTEADAEDALPATNPYKTKQVDEDDEAEEASEKEQPATNPYKTKQVDEDEDIDDDESEEETAEFEMKNGKIVKSGQNAPADIPEGKPSTNPYKTKDVEQPEEDAEEEVSSKKTSDKSDIPEGKPSTNPYKTKDVEQPEEAEEVSSGKSDIPEGKPVTNPYKTKDVAEEEEPEPEQATSSKSSGKLDDRSAEEQKDAGQGDRQNAADAEKELPATNPYKNKDADVEDVVADEPVSNKPGSNKPEDQTPGSDAEETEEDALPATNPYKNKDSNEEVPEDQQKAKMSIPKTADNEKNSNSVIGQPDDIPDGKPATNPYKTNDAEDEVEEEEEETALDIPEGKPATNPYKTKDVEQPEEDAEEVSSKQTSGKSDIPEGKPETNPYKTKDVAEEEEPEKTSGKLDDRSPDEQKNAGQGDRMDAEKEEPASELPPTNPYKDPNQEKGEAPEKSDKSDKKVQESPVDDVPEDQQKAKMTIPSVPSIGQPDDLPDGRPETNPYKSAPATEPEEEPEQELPPTNPYKDPNSQMGDKPEKQSAQSEPAQPEAPPAQSGKLDTRSPDEQKDAGQGDRQNAEAEPEKELPATNPYKSAPEPQDEPAKPAPVNNPKEQAPASELPATNPYKSAPEPENEAPASELPATNPYKDPKSDMGDKPEQKQPSQPEPEPVQSGKLDERTADEQKDAGQGDRQNAEAEKELPATNPYKSAPEPEDEPVKQAPGSNKPEDQAPTSELPATNPYKSAPEQQQQPEQEQPDAKSGKLDERTPEEQLDAGQGEQQQPSQMEDKAPMEKSVGAPGAPPGAPATNPYKHPMENEIDVPGGAKTGAKGAVVSEPESKGADSRTADEQMSAGQNSIAKPADLDAEDAEEDNTQFADDGKPIPDRNPPAKKSERESEEEMEMEDKPEMAEDGKPIPERNPPAKKSEEEEMDVEDMPELAEDGKPMPPKKDEDEDVEAVEEVPAKADKPDLSEDGPAKADKPELSEDGKPKPSKEQKEANKPELNEDGKPKKDTDTEEAMDAQPAQVEDQPELASDGEPKPPPPADVQQNDDTVEVEEVEEEAPVEEEEEVVDAPAAKEAPEAKSAPEAKEAPEPKAAPEGKAADEDVAEVVWPVDPSAADQEYGVPDYSKAGYEGEDVAEAGEEYEEYEAEEEADAKKEAEAEADIPAVVIPVNVAEDDAEDVESVRAKVATSINIYYLVAGQTLYEDDTKEMAHPFASAIAKPFHVVDEFAFDEQHTFAADALNRPVSLSMKCIFGRDGSQNDLFAKDQRYQIVNEDCEIEQVYRTYQETLAFGAKPSPNEPAMPSALQTSLVWSLVMAGSVLLLLAMVWMFNRYLDGKKKKQMTRTTFEFYESEVAPLKSTAFYGSY